MPHATPARIRTAADRQKLLDLPLTPLWGEAGKVPADAFIVGKVKASQDLRRVTVSLGAFDRQSLFDILEFEAQTDRYVLADIGQGFSLAKRRVRGVSDDAILSGVGADIDATEGAKDHDRSPQTTGFPVELTVYYDQQPQPLSDDPAADGSFNYSLPEPQPGQSLTFGLRNVTDQPVGVVLLVNGVSTLYEQEGEPADLTKWMLEPRKEYRVKGYHQQDNEKYFEITTLSEEESRRQFDDLGGAKFAGLIHLHVFQQQTSADETPPFTRSIGRLPRQLRQPLRFASRRPASDRQEVRHLPARHASTRRLGPRTNRNVGRKAIWPRRPHRLADRPLLEHATVIADAGRSAQFEARSATRRSEVHPIEPSLWVPTRARAATLK